MNEAMGREANHVSDSTKRRIANVSDELVRGLFFADEFALESSIHGCDLFQTEFESMGPVDSKGRSLRQFDLSQRMFRFPCSYLILSEHFDALPSAVMNEVKSRISKLLHEETPRPEDIKLSQDQHIELIEILNELKPGWLP
jgi:hypothetical protein